MPHIAFEQRVRAVYDAPIDLLPAAPRHSYPPDLVAKHGLCVVREAAARRIRVSLGRGCYCAHCGTWLEAILVCPSCGPLLRLNAHQPSPSDVLQYQAVIRRSGKGRTVSHALVMAGVDRRSNSSLLRRRAGEILCDPRRFSSVIATFAPYNGPVDCRLCGRLIQGGRRAAAQ